MSLSGSSAAQGTCPALPSSSDSSPPPGWRPALVSCDEGAEGGSESSVRRALASSSRWAVRRLLQGLSLRGSEAARWRRGVRRACPVSRAARSLDRRSARGCFVESRDTCLRCAR